MRVLVVTNMYPPHHYGGYELSCRDVVERWRAAGHDVTVLTSDLRVPGVTDPPDEDPASIRRVLPIAFADGDVVDPPRGALLTRERTAQRALADALAAVDPEVVSVWHMGAMPFGLLSTLDESGRPLAYVVCDDWLSYGPTMDPWMRHFVDRPRVGALVERVVGVPARLPDLGRSGAFLFVSDETRSRSGALSRWRYPLATVTYSGFDTADFPLTTPDGDRPWQDRLLFVGRLDARKGAETAIRALAELPTATLELLGRGDAAFEAHLHDVAAGLGVGSRVTFDFVDRRNLRERFRAADAFLFPCEWEEPFGLVPLEAMACGTPVVATGMGGSAEFLVDGWNCVEVAPADPHALAAGVQRLARDPSLRATVVAGGAETAAQLTVDALAEELWRWHEAAAGRFAGGRPPHRRLSLPGVGDPLSRHRADADDVLDGRGPDAVKRMYADLAAYWEEAHGDDPTAIPVLSAPETHPVVAGLLADAEGLVLDAGCGPRPALSITLGRDARRVLVALDMGVGTVRLARADAATHGVELLGVVADVERLPFRAAAFAAAACEDTIEHVPDDVACAAELARVVGPRGRVVIATPNRASLPIVKQKVLDRVRGRRREPSDYFVSNSHLREYTWAELERVVGGSFDVRRRAGVGWLVGGWKRRAVSRLVAWGPGRRVGQMIVVELSPRNQPPAYSSSNAGTRAPAQS